jgi:hypothetical protein
MKKTSIAGFIVTKGHPELVSGPYRTDMRLVSGDFAGGDLADGVPK